MMKLVSLVFFFLGVIFVEANDGCWLARTKEDCAVRVDAVHGKPCNWCSFPGHALCLGQDFTEQSLRFKDATCAPAKGVAATNNAPNQGAGASSP